LDIVMSNTSTIMQPTGHYAQQDQNGVLTRDAAQRIAAQHYTTLEQLQIDEPKLKLTGDRIRTLHLRWALGY
jgi:predicted ATPase